MTGEERNCDGGKDGGRIRRLGRVMMKKHKTSGPSLPFSLNFSVLAAV